jgi:hypothetical protein
MAKINKAQSANTHEGAKGRAFAPEQQLRRALMSCMLWEDQFYEDGVSIAERIGALVPQVDAEKVAAMAIEAREDMKLRHAPLLIVREMARHEGHKALVADTLERIVQRPDELTEFLAIYWADALGPMQQRKRAAVSAQVKKGLARALTKFDAYQLAKYDRDGAVRIRDVLFLTHAKPKCGAGRSGRSLSTAAAAPTPGRSLSGADKRHVRTPDRRGSSAPLCCATCAACRSPA